LTVLLIGVCGLLKTGGLPKIGDTLTLADYPANIPHNMVVTLTKVFGDLQGCNRRSTINQGHGWRRNKTSHNASTRTFEVHEGNPTNRDCRALKTARGTADLFPLRVFYSSTPGKYGADYTLILGKEKGQSDGWRGRHEGVLSTV
jgi:hypothetical protein